MKTLIVCCVLASTTAALAQPDLPGTSTNRPATGDAERIVCEVRADPSSRLNRRRICMTEAKWAQHRRELREWTDRAQLPWGAR